MGTCGLIRHLFERLWVSAWLRLLAGAGNGRRMRGENWRGLWLGRADISLQELAGLIDDTYWRVAECVRADLGIPAARRPRFNVICDDTSRGMKGMLELLRPWDRHGSTDDEVCAGLACGKMVFVSQLVESPDFRETLAHELCHAWGAAEYRGAVRFHWLEEAYAHNVACRVGGRDPAGDIGFSYVSDSLIGKTAPGLQELLLSHERDSLHFALSGAFVHFLYSLRAENPGAWEFVREGLTGRIPRPEAIPDRLHAATRMPLQRLAGEFSSHCRKMARDEDSRHAAGRAQFVKDSRRFN